MPVYDVYAVPQDGFWRAGMYFESHAPTRIDSKEIQPEKLQKVLNERMLRVIPAGIIVGGTQCSGCGVAQLLGGLSLKTLRAVASDKGIEGVGKMSEPDLVGAICETVGGVPGDQGGEGDGTGAGD
ncbi:MAG: hypothetical protein ACYDDN_03780 [Candidatus Desulforudaceae bacterium]